MLYVVNRPSSVSSKGCIPVLTALQKMRPTKATVSVAAAILSFLPEAPNAFTPALRRAQPARLTATSADSDDADGKESADWRAFRAKLVQEGLPSLSSAAASSAKSEKATQRDHHMYAYETTPLVEVGTVLVSIPTTDLCQALEQQYWHRAVVLITDVSDDKINGAVETVPSEQLAQGAGRGKWSYRGVLLNRPTDLVFDDATGEQKHGTMSELDGWKILRGGDLAGLDSSDGNTEFICFHDLSDDGCRRFLRLLPVAPKVRKQHSETTTCTHMKPHRSSRSAPSWFPSPPPIFVRHSNNNIGIELLC